MHTKLKEIENKLDKAFNYMADDDDDLGREVFALEEAVRGILELLSKLSVRAWKE